MANNRGVPGGDDRDRSAAGRHDPSGVPDFGSFMRQIFPDGRMGDAQRGQPAQLTRRDYETALTLLHRASEAFPALLRHCQQLEADMRRVRADADADVRAAQSDTHQWQQVALAMKMHIEEAEHQIAVMRKQLQVAEERLAAGQNLATAAEQQASLAIGITTLFHDKIIDAFGVGSPAHATLDAVAQGALTAPLPGPRG